MPDLLLDIKGLETQFKTPDGIVHAVNGVSFIPLKIANTMNRSIANAIQPLTNIPKMIKLKKNTAAPIWLPNSLRSI